MMERTPENPWGIEPSTEPLPEIFLGPGMDSWKGIIAKSYPGCTLDYNFLPQDSGFVQRFRAIDGSIFLGHGEAEIIYEGKVVMRIKAFFSHDENPNNKYGK